MSGVRDPRLETASAHTTIGADFLKQRRIPGVYCRLARDHHRTDLDPGDVLMAIIRLADLAVGKLEAGTRAESQLVLASTAEAACLDLDEIVLAELEVMLEDAVAAVA